MPVDVTTARARPRVMPVPAKTIERLSASGVSSGSAATFFSTGSDSPVSVDSSTSTPPASSRRASAGTASPSRKTTMSPVTSCSAGISCSRPSRTTLA